jgi:hypothetical protein
MKKIALFIIVCIAFVSCNRDKQFKIKGLLENSQKQYVYLAELNINEFKFIDSAKVSGNGNFSFKQEIDNPGIYYLFNGEYDFITLLVFPKETIKISANSNDMAGTYTIEGSEGSAQVKLLNDKLVSTRKSIDSLQQLYINTRNSKDFDSIYTHLNTRYSELIKEQRNFSIKFILGHLTSLASIVALYQQIDDSTYVLNQNRDVQLVKLVADSLMKYYPGSKHVQALNADKDRMLSTINRLKIQQLMPKNMISVPDIALLSTKGDTARLSEIKNKCIIINFWSPEVKPSIYAILDQKDIYEKYKKKGIEMYQVALTKNVNAWAGIIKANKIPGINVIDPLAENSYYKKIYNVTDVPAMYIIDKKGNIVGKDISGVDLADKLEQIMK